LPVSACIPWRFVVNFRADPRRLRSLVPAPLLLDEHAGDGIVSACVLSIERMGVVGAPRLLRFSTLEILYRVAVRVPRSDGSELRSFLTLRSEVSAWAMAALGRRWSHFRPRLAAMRALRGETSIHLACRDRDGHISALHAPLERHIEPPPTSRFGSLAAAVDFVLGVPGAVSVDAHGRVRFQDIEHPPWDAGFTEPSERRFALDADGRLGLRYDSTLLVMEQKQTWKSMRRW
jgi:hypothetical protein